MTNGIEKGHRPRGETWPQVLRYNYEEYGDRRKAMRVKHYGIWQAYTWKDYYQDVKHLALGLLELGFEPGDKVLIIGDNAPPWYNAELAAQADGGASVGVFPDLPATEIKAIAQHCDARYAVVEGQEQVDKLLEILVDLRGLRRVIYWN
jgi:long-chain acyl-CoA synthetase